MDSNCGLLRAIGPVPPQVPRPMVPKDKNGSLCRYSDYGGARIEEAHMSLPENSSWKTRLVERGFPDRSFDIEFWQEQGDEAIFAAAWEMVELAEETSHGRKPTLQRTATTLKPIRS
jgi:hypothetical protein